VDFFLGHGVFVIQTIAPFHPASSAEIFSAKPYVTPKLTLHGIIAKHCKNSWVDEDKLI
jgi:hypothetical protein